MKALKSNFYLIKVDDKPVYVGYTNRPIKTRFREHLNDKDFGDGKVSVESLGSMSFDFTWDITLINQYAKEVSDRETELIAEYGTATSVWQKGIHGLVGGTVWSDIKHFVMTNKDNPKFADLSEDEILAYLQREGIVRQYMISFVGNMRTPISVYMNNFVNHIESPVAVYMKSFVGNMGTSIPVYMHTFVNSIQDPVASYMSSFVDDIRDPVTVYMSSFVNHQNPPVLVYMKSFVSTLRDPVDRYMADFVNGMKLPEVQYMKSFVSTMILPEEQYMKSFVTHMSDPTARYMADFVNHIKVPTAMASFVTNMNKKS